MVQTYFMPGPRGGKERKSKIDPSHRKRKGAADVKERRKQRQARKLERGGQSRGSSA